jgi:hypothetical protein
VGQPGDLGGQLRHQGELLTGRLPALLAIAVPLAVLCVVYVPDLGHGFLKDDFAWIAGSRVDGPLGALDLFRRHNGFYRPLVSLSFTVNEAFFALQPLAYGLTNFALVLAGMAGVVGLARALRLFAGAGMAAALLWALNFHGIGGAILWISGRTSLLLTCFALLTAIAFLRSWRVTAAVGCLLALFCKEEALLLPAILAAWAGFPEDGGMSWSPRRAFARSWLLILPVLLYLVLRFQTAAMLPATAPPFYRPTLDPGHLARNVAEYVDRACTFSAAALVLGMLVLGGRPRLQLAERRCVVLGALWIAGAYGLTVFVPVRSSLYAVFPSVGAAVAAAAVLGALWRGAGDRRRRAALAAATLVPVALIPVYRSRNARLERAARFSAQVVADLQGAAAELRAGKALVLHDAPGAKATLAGSFGTLMEDAVRVTSGVPSARVWVEPPPPGWDAAGVRPPEGPAVHYWVRDGRLVTLSGFRP